MSTDVSHSTLEAIAGSLGTAGGALEGTGSGSPTGIDAGVMTGFITSLLGQLSNSAAGVAEGLHAASAEVTKSNSVYLQADDTAERTFHLRGPAAC